MAVSETAGVIGEFWAAQYGCAPDDLDAAGTLVRARPEAAGMGSVYALRRGAVCLVSTPEALAPAAGALRGRAPDEVFRRDVLAALGITGAKGGSCALERQRGRILMGGH